MRSPSPLRTVAPSSKLTGASQVRRQLAASLTLNDYHVSTNSNLGGLAGVSLLVRCVLTVSGDLLLLSLLATLKGCDGSMSKRRRRLSTPLQACHFKLLQGHMPFKSRAPSSLHMHGQVATSSSRRPVSHLGILPGRRIFLQP